jgi:DNA-binding response OmpR family regulator
MPSPVVVVIEDEPQIRRFVRAALEGEGWQVHEADTSKKGLTEAGMRKPDLLVLGLGLPDGAADEAADPVFRFGDVEVDRPARLVRRGQSEVHPTPIEYRLLGMLIANADRLLTHRQLLREVWGPSHAGQSHYLRIYMGHLRQKLEADPAQPKHLLTETAAGYRLLAG